jgi:FAD binding domain/Berberine and berberine like
VLTTRNDSPRVHALRARLTGELVLPGDPGWDDARRAWNLSVDQQPAAVALPASAGDVVGLVEFAHIAGLRIAPQATGHSAGAIDSLADTILVRTERMRGLDIDPAARVARVEAGVTWGAVTPAAAAHGLAPLAGSAHDVGVVGYTLGGGLSFLSRKHGLAANSVTAIEIVTADGEFRRVTSDQDPDLFWALRGGGGSFGVVTAIEFRLYDYAEVYAGMMLFPWERAGEVLHAWRELTLDLPDEMHASARIMQFPPLPQLPEFLRGRKLLVIETAYLGAASAGEAFMRPLIELGPELNTLATVPSAALQDLHMDPPGPVPGASDHAMLDDLTPAALDTVIELAGPGSGSPLLSVELRLLGGALARPSETDGARGAFPGRYMLFMVGMAPTPEAKAAVGAHAARIVGALDGLHSDSQYLNFSEQPGDTARFFDEERYGRLRAVKAGYDPDDMFRSNHPVAPAR